MAKPPAFEHELDAFLAACEAASEGDVDAATAILASLRDHDLREWYVEHAQNTGGFRFRGLGSVPLTIVCEERDPNKDFRRFASEIYARDSFHCRYCESRVLPKTVFQKLASRVPSFALGRTNAARPGIYLIYCATLDHVVPHQAGGRTDAGNLVTSCWPCNYGKYRYSIEQLGMDSPFAYPPHADSAWVETVRLLARP